MNPRHIKIDRARVDVLAPGLLICGAIALLAGLVGLIQRAVIGHDLLEPIVVALLIGVGARAIFGYRPSIGPGAAFSARTVLECSIVLLGTSIQIQQVFAAGLLIPVVVVTGVAASLIVSFTMGRRLGLTRNLALLVAVGNSICGNAAIVAVAPIIKANRNEIANAIAPTAALGVLLVLALPLTIALLGLTNVQYGALAGMSIYSVSQVVAAGLAVDDVAGNIATVVKLTRVILLGPIILVIATAVRRVEVTATGSAGISTYLPWFVTGFVLVAIAHSLGLIPDAMSTMASDVGRWTMIVAIAGLGYGVNLASVRTVGPRVGAAVLLSLVFMITFTLICIAAFGLGWAPGEIASTSG